MDTKLVLLIAVFLEQSVTVETTDESYYKILKFGKTKYDYVMFAPDMSQFETSFTICSWVRMLRNEGTVQSWFSYRWSYESGNMLSINDDCQTWLFHSGVSPNFEVALGTWYHFCFSWEGATMIRDGYIDGVRVFGGVYDRQNRTTLGLEGIIVLGNKQRVGPGEVTYMIDRYAFGGELYQLNIFTRKLSSAEIREMSTDMCSGVEIKYGDERRIKWEDILQKTKYGNVTEAGVGPQCESPFYVWSKLQEIKRSFNVTFEELKESTLQLTNQLNKTIIEQNASITEQKNTVDNLNDTSLEQENAITQLINTNINQENAITKLINTNIEHENAINELSKATKDESYYKILKFGQTKNDYVMFTPDMSQFETSFTICSWVRKLRNDGYPYWFSYKWRGYTYGNLLGINDKWETQFFHSSVSPIFKGELGTWYHLCFSWEGATMIEDIYADGVRVSRSLNDLNNRTRLGQGGTIVLGNMQYRDPGVVVYDDNAFGGELYQLNIFTRKLSSAEIREMSTDMCSGVEIKYGDERGLKWEDILQKTKFGNVTEAGVGPQCESPFYVWSKLQEIKRSFNVTFEELKESTLQLTNQLNKTLIEQNASITEQKNTSII
ncbi:hypothetical protein ACHWQZ_G000268 [Mnemiopsis leidyi]